MLIMLIYIEFCTEKKKKKKNHKAQWICENQVSDTAPWASCFFKFIIYENVDIYVEERNNFNCWYAIFLF